MINYDYLTGIYDRPTIISIVEEKIKKKEDFAFGMIDIDDFKNINDEFGHQYGDEVIIAVAKDIQESLRGLGVVGRFGGDEFMFVLDDATENGIRYAASKIRTKITFIPTTNNTLLTCSIGVNVYPKDGDTYDKLFDNTDKALFIAKTKGKNRYIIFDEKRHGEDYKALKEKSQKNDKFAEARLLTDVVSYMTKISDEPMENRFRSVFTLLSDYYGLDRVILYTGDNLSKEVSVKRFPSELTGEYILDEAYQKNFNVRNVCFIENISVLSVTNPNLFKIYKTHSIRSALQYQFKYNGKIVGAISYEMANNPRTFHNDEITALIFVAMMIGDILIYHHIGH